MRRLSLAALAFVLATVGTVGCAAAAVDTAPPGPSTADPTTFDTLQDFCTGRAHAECSDAVVKACGSKTKDACFAARNTSCLGSAPQGTTFQAKNAPACIVALKKIYADAVLTVDEIKDLGTTCGTKIFSGPGIARSPCTVDYDCASADGLQCVIGLGQTSGKCLAPHVVSPSDACPNEADVCTRGYYCDGKSKTCNPKAAEGQSCYSTITPCDDGLICPDNPFGGGCRAKSPAGAACSADKDCSVGFCDKLEGSSEGNCTDSVQLSTLDSLCVGFH